MMKWMGRIAALVVIAVAASSVGAVSAVASDDDAAVDSYEPQLVNGSPTVNPGWVVDVLEVGDDPWNDAFCMGVLIAPRVVLTAADCALDSPGNTEVVVGVSNLTTVQPHQRIPVVDAEVLPQFDAEGLIFNLGLMLLATPSGNTPAEISRDINAPANDLRGVVWGSGAIDAAGEVFEPTLRRGSVTMIEDGRCEWGPGIESFCIRDGGARICRFDWGAPIVDESDFSVVGIATAYPNTGCGSNAPDVGQRVGKHSAWIDSVIDRWQGPDRRCPEWGQSYRRAPFTDINGSFAQADIDCIYNMGITTGTTLFTYSPSDAVTREQMAAFLSRLWTASGSSCDPGSVPFVDIADSFARVEIACIYDLGITRGTTASTYSPGDTVTREQMAAFLARMWRAKGYSCGGSTPFTDIAGSFAVDDIGCIYDLEITTGTTASTYSPGDTVTREQMGSFMARLAEAMCDQDDACAYYA